MAQPISEELLAAVAGWGPRHGRPAVAPAVAGIVIRLVDQWAPEASRSDERGYVRMLDAYFAHLIVTGRLREGHSEFDVDPGDLTEFCLRELMVPRYYYDAGELRRVEDRLAGSWGESIVGRRSLRDALIEMFHASARRNIGFRCGLFGNSADGKSFIAETVAEAITGQEPIRFGVSHGSDGDVLRHELAMVIQRDRFATVILDNFDTWSCKDVLVEVLDPERRILSVTHRNGSREALSARFLNLIIVARVGAEARRWLEDFDKSGESWDLRREGEFRSYLLRSGDDSNGPYDRSLPERIERGLDRVLEVRPLTRGEAAELIRREMRESLAEILQRRPMTSEDLAIDRVSIDPQVEDELVTRILDEEDSAMRFSNRAKQAVAVMISLARSAREKVGVETAEGPDGGVHRVLVLRHLPGEL